MGLECVISSTFKRAKRQTYVPCTYDGYMYCTKLHAARPIYGEN